MNLAVGVHPHRAKLVDEKNAAVHADAFLLIKTGPFESSLINTAISSQSGAETARSVAMAMTISDNAFGAAREIGKWLAKEPDHRQRANLIDFSFTRQTIEKTGRNAKLNAPPPAATHHHIEKRVAIDARVGDDHFVRARLANSIRQSRKIADHRARLRKSSGPRLRVATAIDGANHAIAQRRTFAHFLDTKSRLRTASNHERGNQIDAARTEKCLRGAQQQP